MTNKRLLPGFGFWELIILILLLMIVAVIIWPVFTRNHCSGSPQTQCINNLKQITLATIMYCQDNTEMYPPISPSDTAAWPSYFTGVDSKKYDCPTSKFMGSDIAPDYGFNGMLGYNTVGGKRYGVALGDIKFPSSCPVLADVQHNGRHTGGGVKNNYAIYDWNAEIDARHAKGAVFGFVDGHASWIDMDYQKISSDRVNYLLSKDIDPYAGCGAILYAPADGVISLGKGKPSFIEGRLAEPLRAGSYLGITGEIYVSDWSAISGITLAVKNSDSQAPRFTVDRDHFTWGANGNNTSESFGKALMPNIWYHLRAYKIHTPSTIAIFYALVSGDGDNNKVASFCPSPPYTPAAAADRAGIYVQFTGKGYVKYKNFRVSRYDIP